MTHCFSIVDGRDKGKRILFSDSFGTIGRGPSNEIRLSDGEVSRVHCRYGLVDGCVQLTDLGSSNGTTVNGCLIDQCDLHDGDRVQIGTTTLAYHCLTEAEVESEQDETMLSQHEVPTVDSLAKMLEQERLVAIRQATASLSHHINNVLQNVNGGSHLIEEGLKGANLEMIRAGWDMVSRNQSKVTKLVNDMLVIGNPYHPKLEMADLNTSITQVLEQLQPCMDSFSIHCDWDRDQIVESFCFDPTGVQTALQNVINCSISACREIDKGRISIRLRKPDEQTIMILVADNGMPLPADESEHVFCPIQMRPGQEANAIELAVSRKLIRGHGGDLQTQQPVDGGNLHTIQLPLAEGSTASTRREESAT